MKHVLNIAAIALALLLMSVPAAQSQVYVTLQGTDGAAAVGQASVFNPFTDQAITWRLNSVMNAGCQYTTSCDPCPSIRVTPEGGTLAPGTSTLVQVAATSQIPTPGYYRGNFSVDVYYHGSWISPMVTYTVELYNNYAGTWLAGQSGTTANLIDVKFVDNQTGWALSETPELFKTINGGNTWTNIQPMPNLLWQHINAICFINSTTGWMVGTLGHAGWYQTIQKTIDGGRTWPSTLSKSFGLAYPATLQGVYFTDAQYGWVVGSGGNILRTIDGGATWVCQTSHTVADLYSVRFFNHNTGIAVGGTPTRDIILRTQDGGTNWSVVLDQNARTPTTTQGGLRSISFVSDLIGRVAGSDWNIFSTLDGGATWIGPGFNNYPLLHNGGGPLCEPMHGLTSLAFASSTSGWGAIGGRLLKSNDGGSTWGPDYSPITGINAVHFLDERNGWAVGSNGKVLRFFAGQTLVANPGFESGTTGWTMFSNASNGIAFTTVPAGPWGAYGKVHINKTSDNMQVYQAYFSLTAGKRYSLSFDAYSPTSRQVHVAVMKHVYNPPVPPAFYGFNSNVQLTAGWKHYEFPFTASGFAGTTTDTRLRFYFVYLCAANDEYYFDNVSLVPVLPKGAQEPVTEQPGTFVLEQNYPNPFNPTTTIRFQIPEAGHVSLKVFDVLGREVASLVNEVRVAGTYTEAFNASNLSSGIYFYRLQAGGFSQVKKLTVLK